MREKLLAFIEKNSRIDLKELAIMLGVNVSVVVNELEAMENEHIICGYHTLINWDKTGIEKVTAMIEVRVTPQRGMGFDKVAERIYNYPEVESVYLISGGFDFMVRRENIERSIPVCIRKTFSSGLCFVYKNQFYFKEIQRSRYDYDRTGKR